MTELKNELEEIIEQNKVDLDDLQEIEEMIAPTCGCGCGGVCW